MKSNRKKYTKRERVAEALNHREPDRVPCDLTIEPGIYRKLCEYLSLPFKPNWWDDWNHAYPDPLVLDKLGVDVYHLLLKETPAGFTIEKNTFRDAWGVRKDKLQLPEGGSMYTLVDYPLKDAQSVADIESYPWPKPEEVVDVSGLEAEARTLYNETDFALTATFGGNVFERAHYLRGMETFLVDLMVEPELAGAVMDRILGIQMEVDRLVLRACGKYLTYMRFRGEDLGTQTGQLISTELFLGMVRPRLEKEWKTAKKRFKEQNPDGKISVHSCGAVFDLVGHFIDMGADILNPVQSSAHGMNTKALKERYGSRISFHGAIDTQNVLHAGTQEEVRDEVRKRILDLAPGGGYICAPSHNIQTGMPVENVMAMYEAIREFGLYPLLA
ncbi:uroporphyrinogen decarboxylase [Clostridia bacterium]|nr:uroporphyrinogen decarboxylase [Clostridia bacterium]